MSAAIRGPAAARFYKAFHAWSNLGTSTVLHAKRRRFVTTASAHEANHLQPTHKRQDSHVAQAARTTEDKHGVQTEGSRKIMDLFVPGARWEQMHRHPTFLHRMQAALDVTVQPIGDPTPDGHVKIRIDAPERRIAAYARSLLSRRIDDHRLLDSIVFEPSRLKRNDAIPVSYETEIPPGKASMLEKDNDELRLRIQDAFSVQLDFVPDASQGLRRMRISGRRLKVKYATNVVVLTSRISSSRSDIDSLRGMTVSSLTSVTLDPEPIISFSIKGPSRTLECITAGHHFNVHFLSPSPEGAQIANFFSAPHDDPSYPFRIMRGLGLADVCKSDHEKSGPFIWGKHVLSRFTCEILSEKSVEIGDHRVVFARVTNVWRAQKVINPPQNQSAVPTFLAYAQAAYRMLAPESIELDRSRTIERARSNKGFHQNEPTTFKASVPSSSNVPAPQPLIPEAETQASQVSGQRAVPDIAERDADEIIKKEAADEFVDAYWRMALDEDGQDSVLEERAADQRALGEAQKPADRDASRPAASEKAG
ncbi:unnamed protein product [Aureobasidium uvarum]|uniref:Flavin reductase like domain-containing protein n=1 Tax=Aureobasidium uvarum TaxID=2773716 RepID=A0A9N8KGA9_9PEZI|nr:unnamed protein product [Aureobasidium uvarum]